MEQVIDKIISELEELRQTDEFFQAMPMETETKLDDPGIVYIQEYPYMFVAPVTDTPVGETMGVGGYDVNHLTIQVGVVINISDYFNPMVPEVSGTRELIKVATLIKKRLRRFRNRRMDDVEGVRDLVVQTTNYVPDVRGETFIKAALLTVVVERQYQHEE
jgi:hypothetical protein